MVLVVVGIGTLISALAHSSITIALPRISAELNIPIDLVSWVMLSFLLAVTVLLLMAGRAGDLFGHRVVYLVGFFLFGITSLLCGLAPNFEMLIFGRVLQGVGGSMMMAIGPALLTTTFPVSQRGRVLGIVATATYIGLTIGPPLGGLVISLLSWRWIFILNVPIVLIVLALSVIYLPADDKKSKVSFDAAGAFCLIVGLPFFLLAISRGQQWGWLTYKTLGSAAVGLLFLTGFITVEARKDQPLLSLDLFRSPVFSGAVLAAVFNYIALFIQIILLPFYLIEALGIDEKGAGLILSAQPLMMALAASPSGWLSDRIGTRGLAVGGMIILAVGLIGLSTVGQHTGTLVVAFWLALMGLGTGVFISPNTSALMGAASKKKQGVAGGVMAIARNFGMMVGIALATLIYQGFGGRTGHQWQATDYQAMRNAFWLAAGVSLLAALTSALRGRGEARK